MANIVDLHTETFGQGASLTLIHGWGAQNSVWRDWAFDCLAPHFKVTLLEMPGFGDSPKIEQQDSEDINQAWLDAMIKALPKDTYVLGWSLGGLMAQQLALQAEDKVKGLICVATTPKFVQTEGWKWAITPELMADFIKALGLDAWALLNRFWKLQLQGSDGARQLMRHVVSHMQARKIPSFTALLQGLQLLRDIDMRTQLAQIQVPTLWILGQNDPLIPENLADLLADLQPKAQVRVVEGAAHMPFTSHPEKTAELIKEFMHHHVSV
jgi:pimeloyl-[acyl-carrier protein] methyl ester esterase